MSGDKIRRVIIRARLLPDGAEADRIKSVLKILMKRNLNSISLHRIMLEDKLKKFPDGFYLEKGQGESCKVCNEHCMRVEFWYDGFGNKCLRCQNAINAKVIPAGLVREDFYTFAELEIDFSISENTARNWIKKGVLISRAIAGNKHQSRLFIFLRADNEHFFPPKNMLGSKEVCLYPENEEPYITWLPWYHYCDVLEYLKDYGIVHYLGK